MSRSYNPTASRTREYTRREFIRNGAAFGAGLIAWNKFGKSEYNGWLKPSAGSMPTITLGSFEVSRLILGSNPFWGFSHGNPRKPENILKAQEMDLPAEFYHLTLGVPDTFESAARDRSLETVRQIEKPMIVFKVFGAGRFDPESAFPYVFKAIRRKDGLCIGVDNPTQVIENADFVRKLT